jgi:hypothetical protein
MFVRDYLKSHSCGLGLIHVNVRSLISKMDLIVILASQTNANIWIITETWLKKVCARLWYVSKWISCLKIWQCWQKWRCLQIHEELLECITTSVPKQFEWIVLNVSLCNNAQLTLVGVYCLPLALPIALNKLSDLLTILILNSEFWVILTWIGWCQYQIDWHIFVLS